MHTHCHHHFPFLLKSALRYAISFNILFKRFWKNEKLKWKNVLLIEIMRIIFFKWTLFIQSDRIIKKQVVKFIERSNALNLRSDTCKMWEFKFSTLSKKRHCKFQKKHFTTLIKFQNFAAAFPDVSIVSWVQKHITGISKKILAWNFQK